LTKLFQKITEWIDLSSSKSVVAVFATGLFVLWATPLSAFKYTRSICLFRNFIFPLIFHGHCPAHGFAAGCRCPACGLTRAISAALKGKWQTAYEYNHLVFVVLGLILAILAYHIYKLITGQKSLAKRRHSG
jgi:RsiW-degrading membrane proteinase PrsW (M82 family)